LASEYTLDAKRKKEAYETLIEVYCKTKCEDHDEEYCLTIYGDEPDKHVFLTESMLKVWASYIVSNFFY
jgi:glycosyltransferase involved in cell wall biosynthesis